MTRRLLMIVLAYFLICHPTRVVAMEGVVRLPQPLQQDSDLFDLYWKWVKVQTGAPDGLPAPRVSVETLPPGAKMALFFPTEREPQVALRIAISPQAIDRATSGDRLKVMGELAHELVHYVLLMAENDWQHARKVFVNDVHHHCDRTFQRLTRHVASIIWQAYHSDDLVRSIDHMVQLSCWQDGHRLAIPRQG